MPVLGFDDFADVTDNGRRIEPRHNRNISISVDRSFLYINDNAFVTGCAGFSGAVLMSSGTEMYWGEGGGWGATGLPGPTGAYGGPPGETGLRGVQGDTGPQGYQGATGVQGETGLIGAQGYTGVQGVTGAQGNTGVQGETGLIGAQGYTGVQGVTGIKGQGVTGVININIDGGGNFIGVGYKGDFRVPYNYQMYDWTIFGDYKAYCLINLYKSDYDNYPPTPTGLISLGVTGPNLVSQIKNRATISGWQSPTGYAGDIIKVEVGSATGLQHISLQIGYAII